MLIKNVKYNDDVLSLNNSKFGDFVDRIYPINWAWNNEYHSRGVAYYVISPKQGVWGLPEAPSGVQG